jgi:hypothetical protein
VDVWAVAEKLRTEPGARKLVDSDVVALVDWRVSVPTATMAKE